MSSTITQGQLTEAQVDEDLRCFFRLNFKDDHLRRLTTDDGALERFVKGVIPDDPQESDHSHIRYIHERSDLEAGALRRRARAILEERLKLADRGEG